MQNYFSNKVKKQLNVNWNEQVGSVDMRCHSQGIGGVHSMPPTEAIIKKTAELKPQLIRIFLQEFFFVYKNGVYDWQKLDAYMDAVHAMGGDIMASICIKPKDLFPVLDEKIFMPNDVSKWQELIYNLVVRYSTEKRYVTHWAIANEVNIGEFGGCPYLIENPDDYFEYYKITEKPIRKALPNTKIGGPSYAGAGEKAAKYLARFVKLCKEQNITVDFAAYNVYTDNPDTNAKDAQIIRSAIDEVDPSVKIYITEFNTVVFSDPSLEESAYEPRRSACQASSILALLDANCLDGTFYYHIYDQFCNPSEFASWYSRTKYMSKHWSDMAHRLGLFDLDGKIRPQYYMYKLLYEMIGKRVKLTGVDDVLRGIAALSFDEKMNLFLSNYTVQGQIDYVTRVHFENAAEGLYRMCVYRIDDETSSLIKHTSGFNHIEHRIVYVYPDFHFDVYTPADSVTLIQFEKLV